MSMPGSSNSLTSNQIMQRFGEPRLKKELKDRGLPTTGERTVLAVRLHNFIFPGALDDAMAASSTHGPPVEGATGDFASKRNKEKQK